MPEAPPRPPSRLLRAYDTASERARQEREMANVPPLPVSDTRTVADKTANTVRLSDDSRRSHILRRAMARFTAVALIMLAVAVALWRSPSRPSVTSVADAPARAEGLSAAVPLNEAASLDVPTLPPPEPPRPTNSKTARAEGRSEPTPAAANALSRFEWTSPRLNKIDVRPTWRAAAIGIEDRQLVKDLQQAVSELWVDRVSSNHDAILADVGRITDSAAVASFKGALKKDGVLWLFYRKGAPLGQQVTAATSAAGLIRLKTVAFSSTHDAAAFVASRRGSR